MNVPKAKLAGLDTKGLIEQYRLVGVDELKPPKERQYNQTQAQGRRDAICVELLKRAESEAGDQLADKFFADAKKAT